MSSDNSIPTGTSANRPIHARSDFREEYYDLVDRVNTVARAANLIMSTGVDSGRVIDLVRLVARSLDCDSITMQISYPQVTLTVARKGLYLTKVSNGSPHTVNSDRVCMLWTVMETLQDQHTVAEVNALLDRIERTPRLYSNNLLAVLVGLACCCYGILNNMGVSEVLGTLIAATVGARLQFSLNRRQVNHLVVVAFTSLVSGLLYSTYLVTTASLGGIVHDRAMIGFIASVLFLVPGYSIVSGSLDLSRLDLFSGIGRIVYAGLVLLAAGIGMWMVSMLFPVEVTTMARLPLPVWAELLLKAGASFVGVLWFTLMFNTRLVIALVAGGIATVAFVLRFTLGLLGMPGHGAVAVACVLIGVLAWAFGKSRGWPSAVLAVPSTLVMIPGAAAYRALLSFNAGNMHAMISNGMTATLTIIGIGAGLVTARMLTEPRWALSKERPPSLKEVQKSRLFKHLSHGEQRQRI